MLILVLLGMYFDAVVVFVTSQTLLFRLALAILCIISTSFWAILAAHIANIPKWHKYHYLF